MIDYTLICSRRKTAAIYVRENGVEVRAPLRMPKLDIDGFVNSKNELIRKRLKLLTDRAERRETFSLNYGSGLLIRGKEFLLTVRQGTRAGFDGESAYLPPGLTPEQIIDVCVQVYRRIAKVHFLQRVGYFAECMGVQPMSAKVNGAKTRWGSCSGKKNINFSWRLIMADNDIIDYVVVHELAHLTEMNHSVRFWSIVGQVFPDYRNRQARLKELQKRLSMENWEP